MSAKEKRAAAALGCDGTSWKVTDVKVRTCCATLREKKTGALISVQWGGNTDDEGIASAVRLSISIDGALALAAYNQQRSN